MIGAAGYLVGVIGLTMAYHVPLNDALARFDPATGDAARTWADYSGGWTALNHLRALAGIVAAGLIGLGLRGSRLSRRATAATVEA